MMNTNASGSVSDAKNKRITKKQNLLQEKKKLQNVYKPSCVYVGL